MVDHLWTSDELVRAVRGSQSGPPFNVSDISINTRTIQRGDLFIALEGNRDGHEYVEKAQELGAAGCLVAKAEFDGSVIQVKDTSDALGLLAQAARERAVDAIRVAVTGSAGKTSVTQALGAVAKRTGKATHFTQKNYNNQIGVPWTLARMPKDTHYAVFELGMDHANEIGPLSRLVQPDIAIITKIAMAHTKNFEDGEAGVARAKAEIFEGLKAGGCAILNRDNAWFDTLQSAANDVGAQIKTFSAKQHADVRLLAFEVQGNRSKIEIETANGNKKLELAQPTDHWAENAMAIVLAGLSMGIEFDIIAAVLAELDPVEGRGNVLRLKFDGKPYELINDSYNANQSSMQAALQNLAKRSCEGRRIAVLTDMLDIGEEKEEQIHRDLSETLQQANVDLVFAAGSLMRSLFDDLPPSMRGEWTGQAEDLVDHVKEAIEPNDVVLVKGSNGSNAHLIVSALSGPEN